MKGGLWLIQRGRPMYRREKPTRQQLQTWCKMSSPICQWNPTIDPNLKIIDSPKNSLTGRVKHQTTQRRHLQNVKMGCFGSSPYHLLQHMPQTLNYNKIYVDIINSAALIPSVYGSGL